MASFMASLSVREPELTACTLAPSRSMRSTLGACRLHVFRAHEDLARRAEQRARGGGGDAVLTGTGLGDHARLAHALGEQDLADACC